MEILEILEEVEDSIEKNFSVLGFTLVNKENLLSMLEELRLKLPDEIKQAKWVKEERQKILSEAEKEANSIIESAKEKVIALIDEHEIAKQAKTRAEQIMADARAQELEMRKNAISYADSMLEKVESISASVVDQAREGRRQLR
ncbi:MAG: ATPase [Clostridia bacterium]|nr:ATPase [Clostridia bacterium]